MPKYRVDIAFDWEDGQDPAVTTQEVETENIFQAVHAVMLDTGCGGEPSVRYYEAYTAGQFTNIHGLLLELHDVGFLVTARRMDS